MKKLSQISLKNKRVLVRCDVDVVKDGKIKDDQRLIACLSTLQYILAKQPKQLIIMGHAGNPKGEDASLSLESVRIWFEKKLKLPIATSDMHTTCEKKVVMWQNLRFYPEEKQNKASFAKKMAKHADVYINNAFATSHRKHASMVAIQKYLPSAMGLTVQQEVDMLQNIVQPTPPFHAIVGFAKIGDKLTILKKIITKADKVYIGGAVVFTFLKALGYEVGKSLVDDAHLLTAKTLYEKYQKKIVLPVDITVQYKKKITVVAYDKIPTQAIGYDIGPLSTQIFKDNLQEAKTIFWNGPVGMFEQPPFDKHTVVVAKYLAQHPGIVIIGGGDTTKAVKHAKTFNKYTHVSTGGGASLAYIQKGSLIAIPK
ncbi:MAG: phosphoglycerate kinase [Candidatus Woesearchaeota archaeon]